jgi:hypothetical protein
MSQWLTTYPFQVSSRIQYGSRSDPSAVLTDFQFDSISSGLFLAMIVHAFFVGLMVLWCAGVGLYRRGLGFPVAILLVSIHCVWLLLRLPFCALFLACLFSGWLFLFHWSLWVVSFYAYSVSLPADSIGVGWDVLLFLVYSQGPLEFTKCAQRKYTDTLSMAML